MTADHDAIAHNAPISDMDTAAAALNADHGAIRSYRKRPVEIQAIQWTGRNTAQICTWVGGKTRDISLLGERAALAIHTLEGVMRADVGDWIIRGIKGEFYPCKPDIFEATYEPVDDMRPPVADKSWLRVHPINRPDQSRQIGENR
jgi:hypothetical protein